MLDYLKTNTYPYFEIRSDAFQAGFKVYTAEDDLKLPTSTSQLLAPVYEMLGIEPGASWLLGKHSTNRAIAPTSNKWF